MTKHLNQFEQMATNASYSASGVAVFLGLTVDEWGILGVIVGITLSILTFGFNVWFKMQHLKKG